MESRRAALILAVTAALAVTWAAPAGGAGRRVTVTGTLAGARGMSVLLMAPAGTAVRGRVGRGGRFALSVRRDQARSATLQLLGPDGRYFGPVVLGGRARRLLCALAGRSVGLGRIALGRGYARALRAAPTRALDVRRVTIGDRRGVPIGAGRLGLVRVPGSPRPRASGRAASPAGVRGGADSDRDGVPDGFDVDANGNLVLNNFDSTAVQTAGLFSTLFTNLPRSLNVNAGGVEASQIDALISGESIFNLIFFFDAGYVRGASIRSVHVDCGTLSYCRRGDGTGIIGGLSESGPDLPRGTPWARYSPDGSGLPNLEHFVSHDGTQAYAMSLQPHATTAQMRPGDTYDVVFETDGGPAHVATTLSPYFVTTPAVDTYSSGGTASRVAYPASDRTPGAGAGDPIVLGSGSITLSFWRPQRLAIPGVEAGPFLDIGHLHYGVVPTVIQAGATSFGAPFGCRGHYSDVGGGLVPAPASSDPYADEQSPFVDEQGDAAPSPARRLSLTLDVAGCLSAHGVDPAGQTVSLGLGAAGEPRPGGQDRALQNLVVRLPG